MNRKQQKSKQTNSLISIYINVVPTLNYYSQSNLQNNNKQTKNQQKIKSIIQGKNDIKMQK